MAKLANKFPHLQIKQTKICKYRTLYTRSKIPLWGMAGEGEAGGCAGVGGGGSAADPPSISKGRKICSLDGILVLYNEQINALGPC